MPTSASNRSRQDSGITLVELIVVLAVVAILTTLVAPTLSSMLPGRHLDQATAMLQEASRSARTRAIASGTDTTLSIDVFSGRLRIGDDGSRDLPPGVGLQAIVAETPAAESGVAEIVFFADGTSSGGLVKLTNDEAVALVRVDWFDGRVRRVLE